MLEQAMASTGTYYTRTPRRRAAASIGTLVSTDAVAA